MHIRAINKNTWNQEEIYVPVQFAVVKKMQLLDWNNSPIDSLKKEHQFVGLRIKNPLATLLMAALYAKVWKQDVTHVLDNMLFSWDDLRYWEDAC